MKVWKGQEGWEDKGSSSTGWMLVHQNHRRSEIAVEQQQMWRRKSSTSSTTSNSSGSWRPVGAATVKQQEGL